jgi:hypothetical protein
MSIVASVGEVEERATALLVGAGSEPLHARVRRRIRDRGKPRPAPTPPPDGSAWAPKMLAIVGISIVILALAFRFAAWASPVVTKELPVTIGQTGAPLGVIVAQPGAPPTVTTLSVPAVVLPPAGGSVSSASSNSSSTDPTGATGATGTAGTMTATSESIGAETPTTQMSYSTSETWRANAPSDGLMTLLIASGAGLALAGAFWWRGFTFTGPGWGFTAAGVTVPEATKVVKKLVPKVKEALGGDPTSDQIVEAIEKLVPLLTQLTVAKKVGRVRSAAALAYLSGTPHRDPAALLGTPLSDEDASAIVDEALALRPISPTR